MEIIKNVSPNQCNRKKNKIKSCLQGNVVLIPDIIFVTFYLRQDATDSRNTYL